MGLTRIRAEQISDIDFKQAVRVITLTDITLNGGAPASVDGVNLALDNRILVAGQDDPTQNGIYYVTTVGAGSTGTWARALDANSTGEMQAGMIVMVTEGDIYKDTQWTLTTNDPIVLDVSPLNFSQISGYSFGNIYANGTAVLANTVGGALTLTAGTNVTIVGNNTTKTITISSTGGGGGGGGNVTVSATPPASPSVGDTWIDSDDGTPYLYYDATDNGATGQWAETNSLYSFNTGGGGETTNPGGNTTEVQFNSSGSFAGSSNFTFDGSNVTIAGSVTSGNVLPSANVTYSLGSTSKRWKDLWIANSSIYMGDIVIGTVGNALTINGANVVTGNSGSPLSTSGNVVGGNITTTGLITATGNVTGGNFNTAGLISATGNITGGNLSGTNISGTLTTASQPNITAVGTLTSLNSGVISSSGNVTGANILTSGLISATGNITGGNLSGTNISGTLTTASQTNITALGTLTSLNSGVISSSGNVTGANLITGGLITATGNVTGGNVTTVGLVSAAGNIQGGNISTTGRISSVGNVTGNNVQANLLSVYTSANASGSAGDIGWNYAEATFNMYLENGVVLQAGQEQNFWVIASGNINNGQVAAFAGAANNAIIASVANAAAPGFSAEYVIGVATQDILDGTLGYVTTYGKVRDINTNAFNVGDILYLDPTTPGGFVNTVPTAPNPKIEVAAVLQKGVADGCIVVRPTIFPRLENLQDVDASFVSNKDYLRFTTTGNLWQHTALDIADDTSPVLGGNLEGNNYNIANVTNYSGGNLTLTGAAYASGPVTVGTQLATKAYVDNQVSTGLHIHEPVKTETAGNLNATYADGGTTQTVDQISGNKTLTFTTSPGLSVNDVIVFTNSFNGITGGQAYFVYSTNGTNQITLSNTYEGAEITNLSNGGPGLAQPSRANSGVGATLTNAGANVALNLSNVALSVNDRVLVYKQTSAFQNGVYVVSDAGNATARWVMTRSSDTNKYAPQDPNALGGGDYFFVTNGDAAGESYVCNNDGVIIFGTTNIGFTLFGASPNYTGTSPIVVTGQIISLANTTGTSDVVVLQNSPVLTTPNIGQATGTSVSVTGNIIGGNILASGLITVTGNITAGNITTGGTVNAANFTGASVSVSGNVDSASIRAAAQVTAVGNIQGGNILTGGLISAAGNITGNYIFGNGSQLTGISTSVSKIFNGTSEANIGTSGGNANVTIGGTSNVAVFASSGLYITGLTSVTANVIAGNITTVGLISATGAITSAANVTGGNITTAGLITATGNIQSGNVITGGLISAAGNINAGNLVVSGGITDTGSGFVLNTTTVSNIALAPNSSNVLIATTTGVNVAGTLNSTGNLDAGNLRTVGLVSATGTITSSANITGGNLLTGGLISATSTITSAANVIGGNITTVGIVSATANIQGGNILTGGLISATGNITGGNINGLVSLNTRERTINYIIDGGGTTITTGSKGYVVVDANCTIQSWTILNDTSGNANVDIKRSTYANFPTTTSIAGTIPPTTTNATKNQNTTLTGWGNTTIVTGDILEFVVQGTPANVTRTTVSINLVSSS